MSHRLEGVRLKVARGDEHLDSLQSEIANVRADKVNRVEQHFDNDADCVVAIARIDTPPLRLGILVGEAVQQYRSALDHLAFQLAVLRHPGADSPNFPIYSTKKVWTTPIGIKKESPRDRYRIAFRRDAFTLVEQFQPYDPTNPFGDTLATLQRLSNFDKHQTIHVGFGTTRQLMITPLYGCAVELLSANVSPEPRNDGAELARYRVWATKPNVEVGAKVSATFGVRFGSPAIDRDGLKDIGLRIVGMIDEFEREIPELRPAP